MPLSITGPGSAIGFSGTKEPRCTSSFGKDATTEQRNLYTTGGTDLAETKFQEIATRVIHR